jgi:secreted Zn-dependent insulinase-like peptidase
MPDAIRHLTLANGLQLTLRHAPRLKRSAAALRVHAGSHDAPAKWPGLAHFLEHLFFLGTPRFPLEDGLMRYVQALGGQVNASTRERTTDFSSRCPQHARPAVWSACAKCWPNRTWASNANAVNAK